MPKLALSWRNYIARFAYSLQEIIFWYVPYWARFFSLWTVCNFRVFRKNTLSMVFFILWLGSKVIFLFWLVILKCLFLKILSDNEIIFCVYLQIDSVLIVLKVSLILIYKWLFWYLAKSFIQIISLWGDVITQNWYWVTLIPLWWCLVLFPFLHLFWCFSCQIVVVTSAVYALISISIPTKILYTFSATDEFRFCPKILNKI